MATGKTPTDTARQWLARDALLHIDMTEALRRGMAHVAEAGPQGVLLRLNDEPVCLVSAKTEAEAVRLAALARDAELLVAHQEAFLAATLRASGLSLLMACHQCAGPAPGSNPLPVEAPGFTFRLLGSEWAPFILQHYDNPVGIEYIEGRLAAGVVWGAFAGDAIAGFAGEHGEGSLGMLEVLPAFRRRGVGRALEAVAANAQLERGFVPFTQVTVGNTASLRLQKSLGFRVSRRKIFWLESDVELHSTY